MHVRHRALHRAAQLDIGLAGIVGMDAALHADFGGAALPGLARTPRHFLQRQVVGLAAQLLADLALGKRAETAFIAADIGVVDITVDDVTVTTSPLTRERSASAACRSHIRNRPPRAPNSVVISRSSRPTPSIALATRSTIPANRCVHRPWRRWQRRFNDRPGAQRSSRPQPLASADLQHLRRRAERSCQRALSA